MKIVQHDKTYSWLQYPVSLDFQGAVVNAHMTVKFFGNVPINCYAVERMVATHENKPLERPMGFVKSLAWFDEIFTKDGKDVYVLEFYRYPSWLTTLHQKFDLIRGDYRIYRPHITLPEEVVATIANMRLRPWDVNLQFKELELQLGTT